MGCDIHSRAELKFGDEWETVTEALWPSDWFKHDAPVTPYNVPYVVEPFRSRNYGLFGLLAGVRNYSGLTPLAEPRGVPEDAGDGWKAYVAEWSGDLHSMSWFTHAELLKARTDLTESPAEYGILEALNKALAPLNHLHLNGVETRYVFGFDN